MKKLVILALLIPTLAIGQKKSDTTRVGDSTSILSYKDVIEFNNTLKKGVSYEDYIKLTPEATLTELIRWVIQRKKLKIQ